MKRHTGNAAWGAKNAVEILGGGVATGCVAAAGLLFGWAALLLEGRSTAPGRR